MKISMNNISSKEFIKKIANACEKHGNPYFTNSYSDQVMVLFEYGLALFNVDEDKGHDGPYIDVTIDMAGTEATISTIIIDVQNLLKEVGKDYSITYFLVE